MRARLLALTLLLASCHLRPAAPERSFLVLAVNDVYRLEGLEEGRAGGMARLRSLRRERERQHPDLLLLHAGDFLYPSLLSRRYDGQQMVDVMNVLDGDPAAFDDRLVVTFGNHELEKIQMAYAATLDARVEQSGFRWLGTNLHFVDDGKGRPVVEAPNLGRHVIVTSGGVSVGVFSITTAVSAPPYVARIGDPRETVRSSCAELRRMGAEVVIALTHLEASEDRALLEDLGAEGPDLVIGGHDHEAMSEQVQGRWVLKADADARTVTEALVSLDTAGRIRVTPRLTALDDTVVPDAEVAARIEGWRQRFDRELCEERKAPAGCMDEVIGRTRVRLVGEEIRSRKYETNLGNWVADRMLEAFAAEGAQVAFLNAGTLRLNEDLPPGTPILRRHVEELFGYPAPLRLVAIDGATLERIASRSVEDWSGGGWWLQIAGFAFRHDPDRAAATDLTWLGARRGQRIRPDERILAVTVAFLVEPSRGQDGYTMLSPAHVVKEGPDLKELALEAIRRSGDEGIAPEREGRVCNARERDAPCLAASVPAAGAAAP